MEKLTVKEAVEQGYTLAFYKDEQFQSPIDIANPGEVEEISWGRGVELSNKEPYHPTGISAKDIIDLIADSVEDNHSSQCGDDTNQVYDEMKELPESLFAPIVREIERKLSTLDYYRSSGIELIP